MRSPAIAAALVVLLVARAAAEPRTVVPCPITEPACYLHIVSNSSLRTDTSPDVEVRLPPGWFVDEGTWARIDAEQRRLQDAEHRLAAENRVLRDRFDEWQPGWLVIGTVLAVGLAGGIYLGAKL